MYSVLTTGPPHETHGEARGFSLVYSGNFLFEAELSEMGRLRVNMGIHPLGFQWHLDSGILILLLSPDMFVHLPHTYLLESISPHDLPFPVENREREV